jgi:hypothetical protein
MGILLQEMEILPDLTRRNHANGDIMTIILRFHLEKSWYDMLPDMNILPGRN